MDFCVDKKWHHCVGKKKKYLQKKDKDFQITMIKRVKEF